MDDIWTSTDSALLVWFALKLFLLFDFLKSSKYNAETYDINLEESDVPQGEALSCRSPRSQVESVQQSEEFEDISSPNASARKTWESEDETSPISICQLTPPPPPRDQVSYEESTQQSDVYQARDQFTFLPPPSSHRRSKSVGATLDLKSLSNSGQVNHLADITTFQAEENKLSRGAKLIVDAIQILLPSLSSAPCNSTPQARQSLRAIALALSPLLQPSSPLSHVHTNPIFHPTAFLGSLTPSPSPLPFRLSNDD